MTDRQARKLIYAVIEANKNRFNDDTLEALEMGRTALEQPSRKGHWIKYGKLWKCSECEDLSCCHENYCNHCGADMRGTE